jgi:molybdopterin synthase sulfur carrier subunit
MMKIKIQLFANFRDYLPKRSLKSSCGLEVDYPSSVADVIKQLRIPSDHQKIILINGSPSKETDLLKEGDILSIFPPVAGG